MCFRDVFLSVVEVCMRQKFSSESDIAGSKEAGDASRLYVQKTAAI